jgi:hypothetical protein
MKQSVPNQDHSELQTSKIHIKVSSFAVFRSEHCHASDLAAKDEMRMTHWFSPIPSGIILHYKNLGGEENRNTNAKCIHEPRRKKEGRKFPHPWPPGRPSQGGLILKKGKRRKISATEREILAPDIEQSHARGWNVEEATAECNKTQDPTKKRREQMGIETERRGRILPSPTATTTSREARGKKQP